MQLPFANVKGHTKLISSQNGRVQSSVEYQKVQGGEGEMV